MADNLIRITDAMLENKGVMPLEDIPGLSADAMKAKIEEIIRTVVIPAFNDNMNEIANYIYYDPGTGAAYITVDSLVQTYARIQSATDTDGDKTASIIALKEMDTALKGIITPISNKVTTLETTVGGNNSGLVKQVNDLDTDVNGELGLKTQVNYLQNVVFVVFRPNGADGGSMPQVTRIPNALGNIVLPDGCTYTYTGHTFSGWSLTENGSVDYASGATVSNVADLLAGNVLELFAVWA